MRDLKEPLFRELRLDRGKVVEGERTLELSFASEEPAERWFGTEVLEISTRAVDLNRLNNGGALLLNHDIDQQIGVVERAWIGDDRKARAKVRFSRSELGEEIFQDVRDGIRQLASVGYSIGKLITEKQGDRDIQKAIRWQPLEISIVGVPMDATVGVGRSLQTKYKSMSTEIVSEQQPITGDAFRAELQRLENDRRMQIADIGAQMSRHNPDIAGYTQQAIADGTPVEPFRKRILDLISGKPIQVAENPGMIGMNQREVKQWSLVRAIRSVIDGTGSFERDVSESAMKNARAAGVTEVRGQLMIPLDVLNSGFLSQDLQRALYNSPLANQAMQRDLLVGTASLGGNLVANELHAERFIDLLRNRVLVAVMGATVLNGLTGNFIIPRQSGTTTGYWVTEAQATTESNLTIDQITLTPKAVTALQDYSKNLLYQSSLSTEALIRNDLTSMLARAIDLAALHGTGSSGQPTGIISVSGIGDVAGGTNGAAPTWANIIALETEVAQDNADVGSVGYLTNAKVRGKLRNTFVNTVGDTPIWSQGPTPEFGTLAGYRAGVSNQVSSSLSKGTSTTIASAIFFANWADLLIGQWGPGISILIDPYTAAGNRLFKMYADAFVDVALRHVESVSVMKDALTG